MNLRNVRLWRPRFRVATLFWLMALDAAFFCGRCSDGIYGLARRWWEVTRVRLGGDTDPKWRVVNWPPRSITVNEDVPIRAVAINDASVAEISLLGSRQLCVSPKSEGEAWINFKTPDGRSRGAELHVKSENGCILDWRLSEH
jgi:hypothetical protein